MTSDGRDARLALLATRQAGAFSFAQALAAGFPSSTIGRRLATRAWDKRLPGVFVLGGSESTELQRLWVARLAVGDQAVLTHETSARCHGAEGLASHLVTLTVPHRGHHRLPGVFVHQIDDLATWHRTQWNGLPVSRPSRCVVELGATQPETVIGRVLDDFLRTRRTTVAEVARAFAEVARPGKPGMRRIGRILDERSDGYVPPASELERALFAALDAGGLPAPSRQIELPGRALGGIRGIADAGYLDARIILEADGRRWHDRVAAARRDRERDAQVVRAGWVPLRFVHEQVIGDPSYVCDIVADTRADRLRLLRRAA